MIARNRMPNPPIQCHWVQRNALLDSGRRSPTPLASSRAWAAVARGSPLGPRVRTGGSFRSIHIPPVLLPPVLFSGLLVALWIWKCVMMVVFQNKIIYMPGLPPNARRERIADWASMCGGIQWHEDRTVAADGTDLSLAVATVPLPQGRKPGAANPEKPAAAHVYVLYFQGWPS